MLVPLIVAEFQGVAGRAAVIMRRPTLQRRAGEIGPFLEETPRPFEVVAVRPGGDEIQRHAVTGKPFGEFAIFAAVILRSELAAAAPTLVADAPVADAKRFRIAVGRPFIGQRGCAGGGVAVFDPLLKLLRRAGADVGREIRLDAAQPAKPHEFVSAEVVRLRHFLPATEAARPLSRGPMPSRQWYLSA